MKVSGPEWLWRNWVDLTARLRSTASAGGQAWLVREMAVEMLGVLMSLTRCCCSTVETWQTRRWTSCFVTRDACCCCEAGGLP